MQGLIDKGTGDYLGLGKIDVNRYIKKMTSNYCTANLGLSHSPVAFLAMAQFNVLFLHMHCWPVGKTGKHDSDSK